ncbi:MAG: hypothetical protein KBB83_04325 [Alphaproteobacteria bacterium]|nr:hypothetical protein [Alphaproteobacteria bacterium]
MPQLDFATYTSQLFWLIVSFTILYCFTARVTMPRMAKILDARGARIDGNLRQAEEIQRESEKVRAAFEEMLNKTKNQAHENVMQMIHKVSVSSAQRKKDLNQMMVERVQSSESHIGRQKKLAMEEIRSVSESMAFLIAEKLLDQSIDPKVLEGIMNDLSADKVA